MTSTLTPTSTGEVTPYESIRTAAAIVDHTGAGLLQISGRGAGDLIARVCTRSVDFLLEGQSQQSLILDADGHIVSDVVVHGVRDGFLLQVWPDRAEAVRGHLAEALNEAESEAELRDVSAESFVLAVEGPTSFSVVGRYVDFPISSLAYQSSSTTSWQGHELLVSRTGITGEFGYALIGPVAAADALLADLAEQGVAVADRSAVDVCRMEMRFPNLEAEIPADGATPFDLGLQWMVDFDGDFVGKDALLAAEERDTRPICWQGPVGESTVPAAGTPVQVSDAEVGQVRHAVHSPLLDRVIGTASVQADCAAVGIAFTIEELAVDTVSAPFLIATSFTTSMD